ncbi:MAG TPA: fluoride efflux transporter CrcB [Candidatus Nanopelagicaceae bacterium]
MRVLLITLGAGVGAPLRYLIDKNMRKTRNNLLPLETLLINILGSFVLGLTVHRSANVGFLFGTGFAGAFTTWSAFALETHDLFKTKKHWIAWSYLALTLVLGTLAAAAGNAI